jgi:hypothetical protein
MKLEEFEACNGKPQGKNCCTDTKPVELYGPYVWDYDEDDDYFRHVANDSVRRDYCGLPIVGRTTKALMDSGTLKDK